MKPAQFVRHPSVALIGIKGWQYRCSAGTLSRPGQKSRWTGKSKVIAFKYQIMTAAYHNIDGVSRGSGVMILREGRRIGTLSDPLRSKNNKTDLLLYNNPNERETVVGKDVMPAALSYQTK